MKPIHLHSWIGGAAVMLMLLLAASCTDEEMFQRPDTGNGIAFLPSIVNKGWNAGDSTQTRAAVPASRHSVTELRNAQGGKSLYLHTTETDSIATSATARIATRGAIVTTEGFATAYDGFGVLAWAYQGEWNNTQTPNYIDNAKATAGSTYYGFNPPYFWPGDAYNMAFFAYAPYDEDRTIFSKKEGVPTLTYSVPTDIKEQKDLLACWRKDVDGNKRDTVKLNFSHLCTAIKFKVGKGLENAITSISIKNVYGSGTYSVADGKWTPTGEANGTYTLTIDSKNTSEGTELTTGENVFMMIPQTLPDGAEIEVTFMENGQEQTLTASISDKKEWEKGHTIIYTISRTEVTENIYFTVKATNKEVDYQGGELSFTVKSYKETTKNGSTTTTSMPWKITAYKEEGSTEWSTTAPKWLTLTASEGTGSSTGEQKDMMVTAQTYYTQNPQNDALKAAAEIAGPYDLSTRGGKESMNTANSYIVNAPGTYTLPLVYGNAIVNGVKNESAYKTKNTGEGILQTFINHLGRGITSPYIYENKDANDNNLSAQNAELLWQDVKGLVTDVKLADGGKALQFKVNKEVIEQGNAVVAIRDSEGTIMWSWHIWVTDYNPYETEDNFFNRYLGFCYNDTKIYDPRTVTLRFEQDGTGEQAELTITQTEHRIEDGNCPFYQFGRKDPMLPGTTSTAGAENKTWYDAQGTASTEIKTVLKGREVRGNDVIIQCIKDPDKLCGATWMDFVYYNNWATNDKKGESTSKTTSVKTVYDPSPAGYQVPTRGRLHTFLKTEKNGDKQFRSGYRQRYVADNDDPPFTSLNETGTNYRIYTSLVSVISEVAGGTKSHAHAIWNVSSTSQVDRGMALSVLPAKENSK